MTSQNNARPTDSTTRGEGTPTSTGAVLEERHSQPYDHAHDDRHIHGQLGLAAAAYLTGDADVWPFEKEGFKPRSREEDLRRGAALALAEAERFARAVDGATLPVEVREVYHGLLAREPVRGDLRASVGEFEHPRRVVMRHKTPDELQRAGKPLAWAITAPLHAPGGALADFAGEIAQFVASLYLASEVPAQPGVPEVCAAVLSGDEAATSAAWALHQAQMAHAGAGEVEGEVLTWMLDHTLALSRKEDWSHHEQTLFGGVIGSLHLHLGKRVGDAVADAMLWRLWQRHAGEA